MVFHHFITIFLMIHAYFCGKYIYGLVIFFLHDSSELPLNFGWFIREFKGKTNEILMIFSAFSLLIFWFYFRIYGYF